MVRLRLFATAREAAGRATDEYDVPAGTTVATLLAHAVDRYGTEFADVLGTAGVWLNGDDPAAGRNATVADGDEVAVLPPVSGGALNASAGSDHAGREAGS